MSLRSLALLIPAALFIAACGGKNGPGAATGDTLDKAGAVAHLEAVMSALDSKSYGDLTDLMAVPEGKKAEFAKKIDKIAPTLTEKKEISAAGIKVMAEKGTYGALSEVFPERGVRWAGRYNADPAKCMGFGHENGEAAFCKLDGAWRIIRLDDIGKLAP